MNYTAKHKNADSSARKIRPFADLIRGMHADEALEQLRFFHNKGARLLEKVVRSAIGNAEDRGNADPEDLIIVESRIDAGPIMKRIQPRARGMEFMIHKKFCHIVVTLSDGQDEE